MKLICLPSTDPDKTGDSSNFTITESQPRHSSLRNDQDMEKDSKYKSNILTALTTMFYKFTFI